MVVNAKGATRQGLQAPLRGFYVGMQRLDPRLLVNLLAGVLGVRFPAGRPADPVSRRRRAHDGEPEVSGMTSNCRPSSSFGLLMISCDGSFLALTQWVRLVMHLLRVMTLRLCAAMIH